MPAVNPYLVVSLSARALAASAAGGGYPVVAVDLYGDRDTRRYARACRVARGGTAGFDPESLKRAVQAACPNGISGLVAGAGLEAQPALLAELAREHHLLGNSPAVVRQAKDPVRLAGLLHRLGIGHPETLFRAPADPTGWLVKTAGGCGGVHVRPAAEGVPGVYDYFQRQMPGRLWSALLAADGQRALVVGLHEQWTSGHAAWPFAFGGAMVHDGLDARTQAALQSAALRIAAALGLKGLNGIDFIVDGHDIRVLEVNPRPPATIGLYEDCYKHGMFGLHLAACSGYLPVKLAPPAGVRGQAVVYARTDALVREEMQWPDWCADLPAAGTRIGAGTPALTVHASGEDATAVRHELDRRCDLAAGQLERLPA